MTGLRELVAAVDAAKDLRRVRGCGCRALNQLCSRCAAVVSAEADLADAITPDVLAAVEQSADLRTTLARLTADLAAVTAERDMWRGECASISAELDLPPGMRPMEGELRRMLGHNRALLAERDEARGLLDAADTTRREWEVRAATSYADGRKAGLREAMGACRDMADALVLRANQAAHMSTSHRNAMAGVVAVERAMGAIAALAPPAAEPRDEGES